MSLVAYGASSDEDSENENAEVIINVQTTKQTPLVVQTQRQTLNLPRPAKNAESETATTEFKLNLPKPSKLPNRLIEEEDDEFLHKKVEPSLIEKPTVNLKKRIIRQPVKITIPSLSDFGDETDSKSKLVTVLPAPAKSGGLIDLLPSPKGTATLGKSSENNRFLNNVLTKTTSLVPHSVSNNLKQTKLAKNSRKTTSATITSKNSLLAANYENSDDSDDSGNGDFFSLNHEEKLPDVSASEINAMVARKAAKMAELSKNLDRECNSATTINNEMVTEEFAQSSLSSKLTSREEVDIEALCGARAAKRARKGDIQFIEISQEQVTLGRDEWLRNQLQAETEYQPRGQLVGDPGAGTKKKHQITYLAYQAKANEQELQAMWAANRHARRQTQSKYGF